MIGLDEPSHIRVFLLAPPNGRGRYPSVMAG